MPWRDGASGCRCEDKRATWGRDERVSQRTGSHLGLPVMMEGATQATACPLPHVVRPAPLCPELPELLSQLQAILEGQGRSPHPLREVASGHPSPCPLRWGGELGLLGTE